MRVEVESGDFRDGDVGTLAVEQKGRSKFALHPLGACKLPVIGIAGAVDRNVPLSLVELPMAQQTGLPG